MIFNLISRVRTVGPVQADEASKRNADIGMTRNAPGNAPRHAAGNAAKSGGRPLFVVK
jgi:hypothetical protein